MGVIFFCVTSLVVLGTTIWVGYDAQQNQIPTDDKPYTFNNGAFAWVVCCLLLWIAAFPYYLVKRSQMQQSGPPSQPYGTYPPPPAPPAPGANLAELERLAQLRDRGVLTEQEFQDQKAKILGR